MSYFKEFKLVFEISLRQLPTIHPQIHTCLFNKHLLIVYYVAGTAVGICFILKKRRSSCLCETYTEGGGMGNKQVKKQICDTAYY